MKANGESQGLRRGCYWKRDRDLRLVQQHRSVASVGCPTFEILIIVIAFNITTGYLDVRTKSGVWPYVMCDPNKVRRVSRKATDCSLTLSLAQINGNDPDLGFICQNGPYVPTYGFAQGLPP